MTRRDDFVLTRYTDIAEAKRRDVRQLQAALLADFLRAAVAAALRRLRFVRVAADTKAIGLSSQRQ